MLVHKKKTLVLEQQIDRLFRTLFPYPQQEMDIPWVRELPNNRWFCYEHQFVIEVIDLGDEWGFKLEHHAYDDEAIAIEKAICVLRAGFKHQQ